jgi:transcriptional regulator with XRE-family HTH domain
MSTPQFRYQPKFVELSDAIPLTTKITGMRYDPKLFAERLLICRRDLSLDQKELGRRANVSNTYISDLERGRVTNPGIEVLDSLATALGVSIKYLIGISNDPYGQDQLPSDDHLTYEIHQPSTRNLVQRLVDIFLELPRRDQDLLIAMAQTMADADRTHIIGGKAEDDGS